MKTNPIPVLLCTAALILFTSGCGKSEPASGETSTPPLAAEQPSARSTPALPDVSAAATQAVTAIKEGAAQAGAEANNLIAKAKELLNNKQYREALTTLQQASALKLTPEQQKVLDDLKKQIQAAMANSGLGGVLGGAKQ